MTTTTLATLESTITEADALKKRALDNRVLHAVAQVIRNPDAIPAETKRLLREAPTHYLLGHISDCVIGAVLDVAGDVDLVDFNSDDYWTERVADEQGSFWITIMNYAHRTSKRLVLAKAIRSLAQQVCRSHRCRSNRYCMVPKAGYLLSGILTNSDSVVGIGTQLLASDILTTAPFFHFSDEPCFEMICRGLAAFVDRAAAAKRINLVDAVVLRILTMLRQRHVRTHRRCEIARAAGLHEAIAKVTKITALDIKGTAFGMSLGKKSAETKSTDTISTETKNAETQKSPPHEVETTAILCLSCPDAELLAFCDRHPGWVQRMRVHFTIPSACASIVTRYTKLRHIEVDTWTRKAAAMESKWQRIRELVHAAGSVDEPNVSRDEERRAAASKRANDAAPYFGDDLVLNSSNSGNNTDNNTDNNSSPNEQHHGTKKHRGTMQIDINAENRALVAVADAVYTFAGERVSAQIEMQLNEAMLNYVRGYISEDAIAAVMHTAGRLQTDIGLCRWVSVLHHAWDVGHRHALRVTLQALDQNVHCNNVGTLSGLFASKSVHDVDVLKKLLEDISLDYACNDEDNGKGNVGNDVDNGINISNVDNVDNVDNGNVDNGSKDDVVLAAVNLLSCSALFPSCSYRVAWFARRAISRKNFDGVRCRLLTSVHERVATLLAERTAEAVVKTMAFRKEWLPIAIHVAESDDDAVGDVRLTAISICAHLLNSLSDAQLALVCAKHPTLWMMIHCTMNKGLIYSTSTRNMLSFRIVERCRALLNGTKPDEGFEVGEQDDERTSIDALKRVCDQYEDKIRVLRALVS